MDESENVLPEKQQDPFEDLSCMLNLQLTQSNNLCFDILWKDTPDLDNLAILIYAIKNTDLIEKQIREMDTDDPESIKLLLSKINQLSQNKIVMKPDQVLKDEE